MNLEAKISNRTARVGIVGLGYVGLPLAVEYAKAGFCVTGIDLSAAKTDSVNAGKSYIGDIHDEELAPLVAAAIRRGLAKSPVHVLTPAGPLELRWDESIFLTGPAVLTVDGIFHYESIE